MADRRRIGGRQHFLVGVVTESGLLSRTNAYYSWAEAMDYAERVAAAYSSAIVEQYAPDGRLQQTYNVGKD